MSLQLGNALYKPWNSFFVAEAEMNSLFLVCLLCRRHVVISKADNKLYREGEGTAFLENRKSEDTEMKCNANFRKIQSVVSGKIELE